MRLNERLIPKCLLFSILIAQLLPSLATDYDPIAPGASGPAADANSRANFLRALSRSDLSQQAKGVQVSVENGSTVIRGAVKDDRERQTISGFAEEAGCPNIKNEITVASGTKKKQSAKPLIINRK